METPRELTMAANIIGESVKMLALGFRRQYVQQKNPDYI